MDKTEIIHKGWEWNKIDPEKWNEISAEFLPVAIDWAGKFHSMIDIGAGKGRHALYMNRLGFDVQAVDLAESSIQIIKEKNAAQNGSVEARVCDMTSLPYADASFDCAICFHAIYHTDLEGLKKAVSEIRHVLRSGGEAFITFNSKDNPSFQNGESVDSYTIYKTEGIEVGIPHTYIAFEDLAWLLEGFTLVKVQQIRNFIYRENPTAVIISMCLQESIKEQKRTCQEDICCFLRVGLQREIYNHQQAVSGRSLCRNGKSVLSPSGGMATEPKSTCGCAGRGRRKMSGREEVLFTKELRSCTNREKVV